MSKEQTDKRVAGAFRSATPSIGSLVQDERGGDAVVGPQPNARVALEAKPKKKRHAVSEDEVRSRHMR
jgi:hypothetical protein